MKKIRLTMAAILLSAPCALAAQGCGDVISTSTILRADVVCGPGEKVGLYVAGHRVRLNLGHFTVRMDPGTPDTSGVFLKSASGALVEEGAINGADVAVNAIRSPGSTIVNLAIQSSEVGILATGSDHLDISRNTMVGGTFLVIGEWPSATMPIRDVRVIGNQLDANGAPEGKFILGRSAVEGLWVEENIARGPGLVSAIDFNIYGADAKFAHVRRNRFVSSAGFFVVVNGVSGEFTDSEISENELHGFHYGYTGFIYRTTIARNSLRSIGSGVSMGGEDNIIRCNFIEAIPPGIPHYAGSSVGITLGHSFNNDARANWFGPLRYDVLDYGWGNLWDVGAAGECLDLEGWPFDRRR